ncbi:hypothetical protein C7974DRAFT_203676 [Boeremia exigua]|uniref:uncharacterized protein n=1 Tax=Boeremia exigua TaxID=749465 RepID=UPI001E8E8DD1|nr:uncharacterized protein C7974DRAFT_203676 [Boeremia exigua]KAH6625610.1 hypothetical protein C7974DRAFT_203676 [Boeremia exigua]
MPESAVAAGLVVGAVLGAGLLCLGTYLVHRYMNLQSRQIDLRAQHNAVSVNHYQDVESIGRSWETRHQPANRKRRPSRREGDETQNVARLRGGHGHRDLENDLSWADERQLQPNIQQPALAYAHPVVDPLAFGWERHKVSYHQGCHTPAVFQQAVPGTYYAYVLPRTHVARTNVQPSIGQSGAFDELCPSRRKRTHNSERCSAPVQAVPAKVHLKAQPVVYETDCFEVVDEYPSFIEKARRQKLQTKNVQKNKRIAERSERSSSTDLGTCSSSEASTSTEDVHRDSIPSGAPNCGSHTPHDYPLSAECSTRSSYADRWRHVRPKTAARRKEREAKG